MELIRVLRESSQRRFKAIGIIFDKAGYRDAFPMRKSIKNISLFIAQKRGSDLSPKRPKSENMDYVALIRPADS